LKQSFSVDDQMETIQSVMLKTVRCKPENQFSFRIFQQKGLFVFGRVRTYMVSNPILL
jgi:hypothetical protein